MAAADPPSRVRSPDNPGGFSPNLMTVVSLLRTPTAQLAVNGGSQHPEKRKAGGHGPTLADEVEHLLPTPTTTQRGPDANRETREGAGPNLHNAVALLPTPSVALATGGQSSRPGDRIDEMLLTGIARAASSGDLTSSPSAAGSASQAAPRHVQLSLDGLESD